jgi:squalene-hopene/tetraprenyl-beta-curcumene cyclase
MIEGSPIGNVAAGAPAGRRTRTGPRCAVAAVVAGFTLGLVIPLAMGQPAAAPTTRPTSPEAWLTQQDRQTQAEARRLAERGAKYLLSAQEEDGGWAAQSGPGVSALVLKAIIQEPTVGPKHPAVRRGVELVLRAQRDDGGIYSAEGLLKNYESSVVLSMLAILKDPAYAKQIAALQKFLRDNQWDEGQGKSPDDPWYGGAGYGQGKRPDLSNTQMMLEALHDSGLSQDDPAYKKALVFIQRCQMLGETNDQAFARGATEGGFIYSPANAGESKAGSEDLDGRSELRCYGSMTYAGFKSMLYAGLSRDDRRVQAALDWMRKHWTLTGNPNMPAAQSAEGLFCYYHVFGRALNAFGESVIRDQTGREHVWRQELVEQLAKAQKPDGSWVNDADRWMEGLPALTTAYALLALQAACPATE